MCRKDAFRQRRTRRNRFPAGCSTNIKDALRFYSATCGTLPTVIPIASPIGGYTYGWLPTSLVDAWRMRAFTRFASPSMCIAPKKETWFCIPNTKLYTRIGQMVLARSTPGRRKGEEPRITTSVRWAQTSRITESAQHTHLYNMSMVNGVEANHCEHARGEALGDQSTS